MILSLSLTVTVVKKIQPAYDMYSRISYVQSTQTYINLESLFKILLSYVLHLAN